MSYSTPWRCDRCGAAGEILMPAWRGALVCWDLLRDEHRDRSPGCDECGLGGLAVSPTIFVKDEPQAD